MPDVNRWTSDTAISLPEPNPGVSLVPMYGFTFTADGLFHDLTQADHDRLSNPHEEPTRPSDIIFDDGDL
jgi:hypothetical protein